MDKVYSIVVTYNGVHWIEKCLDSLKNSSIKTHIIVIDNNSSDNTVDIIQSKCPSVHLIKSAHNLGFGQANNIAMRVALDANADYVFLLNQDAWLAKPDAIERLILAHRANENYGIISPIHLFGNANRIVTSLQEYLVKSAAVDNDLFSDVYLNRDIKYLYSVNYVCAAAWLLPVSVLRDVGGFDPLFFHYGEDDNYMHRVTYHGYNIGVCPMSVICHDIEDRNEDYGREHNNRRKNLLVELSNINEKSDLNKVICLFFYTAFTKLLFLRMIAAITYCITAIYIYRKAKALRKHRGRNTCKGTNWL